MDPQRGPEEPLLHDYASRLARYCEGRRAIHLHLSRLKPYNRRRHHLRIASSILEPLISGHEGAVFHLFNDDQVVICRDALGDQGRQEFAWVDHLEYVDDRKRTQRFAAFECREQDGDDTHFFAWLTNFRLTGENVAATANRGGRCRWKIENQGFNDAKTYHGLEHICHHHPNSLLMQWLLIFLALTIERLYRLRYLHRGSHPVRSAIELTRLLWLALSAPALYDTS